MDERREQREAGFVVQKGRGQPITADRPFIYCTKNPAHTWATYDALLQELRAAGYELFQ